MRKSDKRIFVLGSANVDFVIPLDRLPREGETLAGGDLTIFPGGKGANQAYAAARLGGNVAMIAAVGLDAFGTELLEKLSAGGVDISLVERSDRPTGCACIYVLPAGRNAIVVSPGANATLDTETAMSKLRSLGEGDFLLAQLETPLETVEAAFAYAKCRGATTVLDPAPARRLPATLLANVDILTPNQTEAGMLLGEPQLQIENFEEAEIAARRLLGLGTRAVILKLGDVGSFYSNGSEHVRAKAFQVDPVDTTAAGDEFNAALAVSLAEGASMSLAMRFANAAAAISVTRHGAQSSAPDSAEVEQFLGCVPA